MSFSSDVKAELCRGKLNRACCVRAEACGVLLYCNHFSAQGVKIMTESPDFAKRIPLLFQKAFHLTPEQRSNREDLKQIFVLQDPAHLAKVWEVCGGDLGGGIAHHINFAFLEDAHCRLAFLRGAFLSGGSVTDPQKSYHLELVTSHFNVSRELTALLLDMNYQPKDTTRKSNYITYFKQSEFIEDLLTAIGAPVSAMAIMNAKVEKNLRNGINRRVNCDAANADKTVDAAQEQLVAIRALAGRSGGLDALGEKLQEAALLRQEFPELSLADLALLCQPPVTKSCLNHRLRKLVSLGREYSEGL